MTQQAIVKYLDIAPAAIHEEMLMLDLSIRTDKIEALLPEEIEEIERQAYQDLEYSMRGLIGETHHNACMARLGKKGEVEIARRDAAYEQAKETYRRVFGIEPEAK